MESKDILWLVLLLPIAAIASYLVINHRRGRTKQVAATEERPKVAEDEQRRDVEQEAGRRVEGEKRDRAEAERRRLGEEPQGMGDHLLTPEEERTRVEHQAHPDAEQAVRKAEEEYRRSEELHKVQGEPYGKKEEAQRTARQEGRLKPDIEFKRLEPVKRGGRPRARTEAQDKTQAHQAKSRGAKPEVVCWKRERQWIVAVEVPEHVVETPGLTVFQDGSHLVQDESREDCWHLQQARGEVLVQWGEGESIQHTRVAVGQEGYLLFKLSGQAKNQGRCVKGPSAGSYLVIVPEHWERDEGFPGPPTGSPEPVSLVAHQALFFILEKGGEGKMAFRTPAGESAVIESTALRFELVGVRLNDASEDVGPLFGKSPPQIRAPDSQMWKDVGTIVAGQEGSGKRKWRKQFSADPDRAEQDLPREVAARKGGWYFLRFYDRNDDLIESLDFRFIRALRQIRILQSSPLPSKDGHGPVCVEFLHEPGCALQPVDALANIQIERQDDGTILTIPPDPTYDETRWLVCPQGEAQLEVTVLVERLWWGIGQEHNAPSQWEDQPLALAQDDFAATSRKALWLRLPKPRWTGEVLVGFERSRADPCHIGVTRRDVSKPLRDFVTFEEIADRQHEHFLKVWIERNDRPMEGLIAVIAAVGQAPPTPQGDIPRAQWIGFGRKKTARAEAVLRDGSGEIKVNEQPIRDYFVVAPAKVNRFVRRLLELDQVRNALSQMEVLVTVTGSSPTTTRQAKAVAHALARALISYDPRVRQSLKRAGFGGVRVKRGSADNGRVDI